MNFKYAALNKDEHRDFRVKPGFSLNHISSQHLIPVSLAEFQHACAYFPVVFVKNSNTGEFESVAITGFQSGENLLVKDGKWLVDYIPQVIARVPLGLSPDPNNDEQLVVVIDENNELVSQTEGQALFDQSGEQTEYLKSRTASLVRYHEDTMHAKIFLELLQKYQLLQPMELKLTINQQPQSFSGIYVVDSKRLQGLAENELFEFHQKGYLLPLNAHLISLHRFEFLASKKSKQVN